MVWLEEHELPAGFPEMMTRAKAHAQRRSVAVFRGSEGPMEAAWRKSR